VNFIKDAHANFIKDICACTILDYSKEQKSLSPALPLSAYSVRRQDGKEAKVFYDFTL
jgi:hypothetical protein